MLLVVQVVHYELCPFCCDQIGVYEPIVLITAGGARQTSLAQDPVWMSESGAILAHADCVETPTRHAS